MLHCLYDTLLDTCALSSSFSTNREASEGGEGLDFPCKVCARRGETRRPISSSNFDAFEQHYRLYDPRELGSRDESQRWQGRDRDPCSPQPLHHYDSCLLWYDQVSCLHIYHVTGGHITQALAGSMHRRAEGARCMLPASARVMCPPRIKDKGEGVFIAFGHQRHELSVLNSHFLIWLGVLNM